MCIKGLDPAGPMFTFPDIVMPDKRLYHTDAGFVQVIHTAAKSLGDQICLGYADYWVNGGKLQPVCMNFKHRGILGRSNGIGREMTPLI